MNFELLHIHHLLVFELTAVGNGDDGDGVSGFQGLSLCHDLRHDLTVVVTQIIPEMSKKKNLKTIYSQGGQSDVYYPNQANEHTHHHANYFEGRIT